MFDAAGATNVQLLWKHQLEERAPLQGTRPLAFLLFTRGRRDALIRCLRFCLGLRVGLLDLRQSAVESDQLNE